MSGAERLRIEPLAARHDRTPFCSGTPELDGYLQRQAGQDIRRRIARVFVATRQDSARIIGFYTLSALSIDVGSLPAEQARRLPRHPLPAALIGRLAVDRSEQGKGLGALLLADAVGRTLRASELLAVHAMVVHAKTEAAKLFYRRFGFIPFEDQPMRLFLPLASPAGAPAGLPADQP